jgi:EmrB/QacA subfamily drug resistance transporter
MSNQSSGRSFYTNRTRLLAFSLVCVGVLMMVLDTTILTVALPSLLVDLHLSGVSATWALNAYMITFGGFLLLSGRLGDLYGLRRVFLTGILVFTLASLVCGFAHTQGTLVTARAVQGVGGATVSAVSLSLIMNLFPEPLERATALGIYGFIGAAGAGLGELLGGLLTQTLGWHWVFLVNLPLGLGVYGLSLGHLPHDTPAEKPRYLDITGAIISTGSLALLVYAVTNISAVGWLSRETLGLLGVVALGLLLFLILETRARDPLLPLPLLQQRNFAVANGVTILWASGTFAWYVLAALYLQRVLDYDPFRVGLAFVPAELIMAVFAIGLSSRVVKRFGFREPLWLGLLLVAAGLALFARAPLGGEFVPDVLPGMVLLGLGGSMSSAPLLLGAMEGISNTESGVASGILNTSSVMGGSLGLAALASLAQVHTDALRLTGVEATAALNSGYHFGFGVGALLAAAGALFSAFGLRVARSRIPDTRSSLRVTSVDEC